MEAVRESWTDERMDDLNPCVSEGFRRTDAEFHALRTAMRSEFAALREEMTAGLRQTQCLMLRIGSAMVVTSRHRCSA
jgi:hypothetical protein